MSVDLDQLSTEIRSMTRRTQIYRVLKTELSAKGYWKSLPRGDPKKGYRAYEKHLLQLSRGK
jgi:hypothetical protein